MDYECYGRIMELIQTDPHFDSRTSKSLRNAIYPAVKHGRVLTHFVDGRMVGFCTWGLFTAQEVETDIWDGDEVYARDAGEVLYLSQFQCRAGPREVIKFCKRIREELSELCPGVEPAAAHRLYSSGNRREALYYRKSA
jgi:hemolysin-activating ACP:hemolysin acyltransferase